MKATRIPALLAGAMLLALGAAPALAAAPKPLEVAFDKCFARNGDAPYLVTFSGPASGYVTGTVEARILVRIPGVQPNQTHLQADYVVDGTTPFTARVGGRVNNQTNLAVLRGYVSVGPAWLVGAGVLDEFENYTRADGTPCSRGTLYITPRWKQSRDDDKE